MKHLTIVIGLLGLILVMVGTNTASFAFHNNQECHAKACALIERNNFLIEINNCLILADIEKTDYTQCLKLE